MTTFDADSHYFSGQGVVMVGYRGSDGKPRGLIPVGNVSDLKLGFNTSVTNHKESQSGQRATDLRLTTDVECQLNMAMENLDRANLALALRGDYTDVAAASVVNEKVPVYFGKISPLAHIKVSSVVVGVGSHNLTAYTNESTPWDYVVNTEAGSIKFNDGVDLGFSELDEVGSAITGLTIGATTIAIVDPDDIPADLVVGDDVMVGSISWGTPPSGGDINGKVYQVTAINRTNGHVTFNAVTTGAVYGSGDGFLIFSGFEVDVDYSYEAQGLVDSFTAGSVERYLRFEGLNTADENRPCVVEVFRFTIDPLQELALIQDDIAKASVQGSVLSDSLRASGSKFFNVKLLR